MSAPQSETTTAKGSWWRAECPENQLAGEITYGPLAGGKVDLHGHFPGTLPEETGPGRFTLQGTTITGKDVTLFDCIVSNATHHIPGGSSSQVSSVSGVVGGHYHSPDEVRFKQATASFSGLREWVWTSGVTQHLPEGPDLVSVRYRLPDLIALGQIGPLSLSIEFSASSTNGFHSFEIQQDCALLLRAEQMQPYSVFDDCIRVFHQFLTFALQRSAFPSKITARIDQPREVFGDTPIYEDYLIIRSRSAPSPPRRNLIPHDLLFTSHELCASPAQAFSRFADRYAALGAALDLYFSTFHHDFSLPRVRFLTLAQSLEAYHRATMPGKYMADEEYNTGLRQRLSAAIPENDAAISSDFRASLQNKLKYLHEYSLRKRLKELASKYGPVLGRLIGDAAEFSAAVSDKRNQLTHVGTQDTTEPEGYRELWTLSEKMKLLLEACVLEEIGFSQERIREIVSTRSACARRVHQGWR